MMSKNVKIVLFVLMAICIFTLETTMTLRFSYAFKDGDTLPKNNFCNPLYSGVKKIYISYKSNLPNQNSINMEGALASIEKRYKNTFVYENIEFVRTNLEAAEVLNNSTNDLYLKIIFSYVNKENFSVPPQQDVMASWVEITRILDENGKQIVEKGLEELPRPFRKEIISNIITGTVGQKLSFFNETDKITDISLSALSFVPLDEVACNVSFYTASKKCKNPQSFSVNNLLETKKECVTSIQDHED